MSSKAPTAGRELSYRVDSEDAELRAVDVVLTGRVSVTATVSLLGKEGTRFDMRAVRGIWSEKGGWKQTAELERVRGVIDAFGKARQRFTIYSSIPAGERLRIYLHPLGVTDEC